MRMVVIAAGLVGINIGGFVMHVLVVAQVLTVWSALFQHVAYADSGRAGGIEGDDKGEKEGEHEAHRLRTISDRH